MDFRNLGTMVAWCVGWGIGGTSVFQRGLLGWFHIVKRLTVALVCCDRLHAWWSAQSRCGNFVFLFDCTSVGRTSDSMTVPT